MESDHEAEFIRAGLSHYSAAVRTVERFVEMVHGRLETAATAEREWIGWTPSGAQPKRAKAGGSNPWIAVTREGTLRGAEAATLSVGLWWRPEGVIAYAHFLGGPDWLRRRLLPQEGIGISVLKSNPFNYFIRRPSDPVDVEGDITALMDELNASLAREIERVMAEPPSPAS